MISSTAPMMALTMTVAAVTWMNFERANSYDSGALADSMARHHFLVLRGLFEARAAGAAAPAAGPLPDPADMGPFGNLHDWQSAVFAADGQAWLVTYPVNYPQDAGTYGRDALQRIPEWLEQTGVTARAYGTWETPQADVVRVAGVTFQLPAGGIGAEIGARAPVIVSALP